MIKTISMTGRMLFGIMAVLIALTTAACTKSSHPVNVNNDGAAIKGYDPVAYFDEGRPVKGSEEHAFQWHGATWLFSSQEHLETFRNDPEKYAPQYGGY